MSQTAASQPAPASDGFVRVEGGRSDEGADFTATVLAYSFIAIVWIVFIGAMWRRQGSAQGRLGRLETALKRKAREHFAG